MGRSRLLTSNFSVMTFGLLVALSEGSLALAQETKNLFQHGFAASSYGDVTLDKGEVHGEDTSALRIRAGVQVLHVGFLGLSLGYQKNGFFTATHSWKRDDGYVRYDYHGPVLELHLFPRSLLSFSAAASSNRGSMSRSETDPQLFSIGCGDGCTVLQERSAISMLETNLQIGLKVAPQLQMVAGGGVRKWDASTSYQTTVTAASGEASQRNPEGDWKETGTFFFLGIRGTTL